MRKNRSVKLVTASSLCEFTGCNGIRTPSVVSFVYHHCEELTMRDERRRCGERGKGLTEAADWLG